ncbi:MAG: transaldolase family protein [Candidatus Aenigmatarchaeota archaeon]
MELFIDTSDPALIKNFFDRRIISGVTTNPTTASKYIKENPSVKTVHELAVEIAEVVGKMPISVEAVGCVHPYNPDDITVDRLYKESAEIINWNEETGANFWQKIPTIPQGIEAIARLVGDFGASAKINATLGFDYKQGLRAAEAGALVFSLFLGRMQATGEDPIPVTRKIIEEYKKRGLRTGFLAASMRTPELIIDSWKAGSDIVTAPPEVLEQLVKNYPEEFEKMISSHPAKRTFIPLVLPDSYSSEEFRHPLLQPGLERFVADAAAAGYDVLK